MLPAWFEVKLLSRRFEAGIDVEGCPEALLRLVLLPHGQQGTNEIDLDFLVVRPGGGRQAELLQCFLDPAFLYQQDAEVVPRVRDT